MWTFRAICADHLVNMVSVVPVSIAVVVSYNRTLQFSLGKLGRELPVTYAQVLFGHEAPERIGKQHEPDLILRVKPRRIGACAKTGGDRYRDLRLDELRDQLAVEHGELVEPQGLLIDPECDSAVGPFPGVPGDRL